MFREIGYPLGRGLGWLLRQRWGGLTLALIAAAAVAFLGHIAEQQNAARERLQESARQREVVSRRLAAAERQNARDKCTAAMEGMRQEFASLMAAGQFSAAADAIRSCTNVLEDQGQGLKGLLATAERLTIIYNPDALPDARLRALDAFVRDDAQRADSMKKQLSQLKRTLEKAQVEEQRMLASIQAMAWWQACIEWGREERAAKATSRRTALHERLVNEQLINSRDRVGAIDRSVEVGMTTCGVYAAFGLPNAINTTTTANHTSAQIVYRSRHLYVYTEAKPGDANGIVRAFQQ